MAVLRHGAACLALVALFSWTAVHGQTAASAPAATLPALVSMDEAVAKLPHASVKGKVIDKDGAAVEAADVFLYYLQGSYNSRNRLIAKTKSSAAGEFVFDKSLVWEPSPTDAGRDEGGRYFVIARHEKHGLEFAVIMPKDTKDQLENLVIQLDKPAVEKLTVVDEADKPIEGAKVFLRYGSHTAARNKGVDRERQYLFVVNDIGLSSGVTDKSGVVELAGLPGGSSFEIVKEGYARSYGEKNVVLCVAAHISGRVTLPDGKPLAGAAVVYNYEGLGLGGGDMAVTDADGRYELPSAPASGYFWEGIGNREQQKTVKGVGSVKAIDMRPGSPLLSQKISFPVNPKDRIVKDIALQQCCLVTGKVVDADSGSPLPGVNLSRHIQTPGSRYLDTALVRSDADGQFRTTVPPGAEVSFRIERSREGSYIIDQEWQRADPSRYQPFRQKIEKNTGVVIKTKLWSVQTLQGRVVDDKDQPVKSASVYVHAEVPAAKTDATGGFTLKCAPKDRDFTLAALNGDKTLGGLFNLKAGATQATIKLALTATFNGQVLTPDKSPASGLKFYIDLHINGQSLYYVRVEPTTDQMGKFTAPNLIPGATYKVFWSAGSQNENRDYDYGDATITLAEIKPGELIRFTAKRHVNTLMGKVVNEKGEPVTGADAQVLSHDLLPQDARYNNDARIKTDKNGEFSINRLAAGVAKVRIAAGGYKTANVSAPSDEVDLKVVLKSASTPCSASITVVDEAGTPVAGAPLNFWISRQVGGSNAKAETKTAVTDASGKATFDVPAAAAQKEQIQTLFWCDKPGYDMAFAQVAAGEDTDAKMVLSKSGEGLCGVVCDSAGKPIRGATVRVTFLQNLGNSGTCLDPDVVPNAPIVISPATTDDQGRFELARYSNTFITSVRITAPGYAASNTFFNPKTGTKASPKSFRLEIGSPVKGRVSFQGTPPDFVDDLQVHFAKAEDSNSSIFSARVRSDWTFTCDGILPGTYRSMIYLGNSKSLQKYVCPKPPTFETKAGGTAEIVLELEEGLPLKGKVITGKAGPVNAIVVARIPAERMYAATAPCEPDGSFEIYLLREDTYELSAFDNDVRQSSKPIQIKFQKNMDPITLDCKAPAEKP